jgi:hypothetical protein
MVRLQKIRLKVREFLCCATDLAPQHIRDIAPYQPGKLVSEPGNERLE